MANDRQDTVEQNDPRGSVLTWIKTGLRVGASHQISIARPPLIVDAHMHIQSGRCAPLPFLWRHLPPVFPKLIWGTKLPDRSQIENIEKIVEEETHFTKRLMAVASTTRDGLYKITEIQSVPTFDVSKKYMYKHENVFNWFLQNYDEYKRNNLSFLAVAMTMDMEYAHLWGYHGIKIYNGIYLKDDEKREKPFRYWYPQFLDDTWKKNPDGSYVKLDVPQKETLTDGMNPGEYTQFFEKGRDFGYAVKPYYGPDGKKTGSVKIKVQPILVDNEETKLYERWDKQVKLTRFAILNNPLKLLSMYHYDPRRWQQINNNGEALEQVTNKGLFIGFKMYTAQGYRPLDRRLPILEKFYKSCSDLHIPIMNHCTPEGAPTYDKMNYKYFRHPLDEPEDIVECEKLREEEYFNKHFVSPEAWKPVLNKYPKLRLCLAHFGGNKKVGREWGKQIIDMMIDFADAGEEEIVDLDRKEKTGQGPRHAIYTTKKKKPKEKRYINLYADISSSFAHEDFRDYFRRTIQANPHIADRIMFGTDWYLTLLDNVDYEDYCRKARGFLDSFDTSLWPKFTCYNPYRFYMLDGVVKRLRENIKEEWKKKEVLYELGEPEPGTMDNMEKEAEFIRKIKDIYPIY